MRWDDFDKFDRTLSPYLPFWGEGETMATQVSTAVNKLVYKWFNDGDVYDNTYHMEGWANDISSFANWLREYAGCADILDRIKQAGSDDEYEHILYDLCEYTTGRFDDWVGKPKAGSVYQCDGPYKWEESYDEEEYDDEEI